MRFLSYDSFVLFAEAKEIIYESVNLKGVASCEQVFSLMRVYSEHE